MSLYITVLSFNIVLLYQTHIFTPWEIQKEFNFVLNCFSIKKTKSHCYYARFVFCETVLQERLISMDLNLTLSLQKQMGTTEGL